MQLNIRPWTLNDLDSLVKYINNWNIAKNMTDKIPFPYTETNGREFIEYAGKDDPIHIFAIDIDGQAIPRAPIPEPVQAERPQANRRDNERPKNKGQQSAPKARA